VTSVDEKIDEIYFFVCICFLSSHYFKKIAVECRGLLLATKEEKFNLSNDH
jgi:hypothetical protein